MEIRLRSTGEVLSENQFRLRFAQNLPSTPLTQAWLDAYTGDPAGDIVLEGPQATGGTRYQYSMRQGVEQDAQGRWFTKYILGPVFTGETAAADETAYIAAKDAERAETVRQTRNARLAETDWRFRSDLTPSQEWKDYCQALRDVPTQPGFPWDITWPDAP